VERTSTVRSFEKLSAGVSPLDADDRGPHTRFRRFGGEPTDYQLIEEESTDGHPHLRLLVHPSIGRVDEAAVADTFLRAIGEGSGVERLVELQWR
jgi:hypothetical protein